MKYSIFLPFILLVVLCLSFEGCKTTQLPTGKGYTELCQTYMGSDRITLTDSWGPPGRIFNPRTEEKVLVYVETKDEYTMNPLAHSALIVFPPNVDTRLSGPGEVTSKVKGQSVPAMDYCITYFEIGPNDLVQKAYWKGNCRSLEKTEAK